jgi:hypothetical protein
MKAEYGITTAQASVLPMVALTGTTIGSLLWGVLADRIGRRAAILLASILFIGTSICGFMSSFGWNVFMCFLTGVSAGGLLPIVYALDDRVRLEFTRWSGHRENVGYLSSQEVVQRESDGSTRRSSRWKRSAWWSRGSGRWRKWWGSWASRAVCCSAGSISWREQVWRRSRATASSRSGFYAWTANGPSQRERRDE